MEKVDIPLQLVTANGREYSKVPLDDNQEEEANNEALLADDQQKDGAMLTHISLHELDDDKNSDKQQLLINESDEDQKAVKPAPEYSLPWKTLISIYFIVWTESAVMNGFNPIIPGMCKDRFHMSPNVSSIASGFLVGGYIFATFLSSFFIGHLSDIYGRQKFMLLGSGMGAICSVAFGLSPWYWLAFLVRFISGIVEQKGGKKRLCNANNALTRAVISDIVPRGPHRAQAYGYHGATVSFARAFSSALSGLISGIIIDPNNPLLDDRYFLPAMFAALMQLAAFLLNIVFVPESNKNVAAGKKTVGEQKSLTSGIKEIKSDKLMQKLILSNCLSSFGNGGMLLGIVLYFGLDIKEFGLGLDAFRNGILFGWFGLAGVIFQISCFKWLLKKREILWVFQFGNMSLAVGCILMPTTSIIYSVFGFSTVTTVFTYIVAGFYCIIMAAGFMTCLPVITTIINNCANPERQGLISGTAQSFSSFLRAFGPILCGIIFAGSVSIHMPFLLFVFLTAIYLSSYSLLRFGISEEEKQRILERGREQKVIG